ncbi:unnamed protein product [Paramecium sonneborni]|uniref:ADP-ribosylation factor n=1 Tax=Paramecium sonneborni TaxID=65129 RepID=A0A8S1Q789_9CILI|nr:unnamed protein product [Paramecium sonneborni]
MGQSLCKLLPSIFKQKQVTLVMIGLDAVGKTSILYWLALKSELISTIPTIGFNIETIKYKNIQFNCFDIGGGDKIRLLWKQYMCGELNGIIFIIDLSDLKRLPEAKKELVRFLNEKETKDSPLLIYANKLDIAKFNLEYLKEYLEFPYQDRKCHIQQCSVLTGQGIYDGLNWLVNIYKSK